MYKVAMLTLALTVAMFLRSCEPPERLAYNTVVAAKAFTDKMSAQHPECLQANAGAVLSGALCVDLRKAVSAKDLLIDAAETYCSGPAFNGGGSCQPPAKGTPALAQATAKMQAAIAAYEQAENDLKGVLK